MPEQFSIAEAKNKLTSLIHRVEDGPPVQFTRRGKPVAVLLSVQEYKRLTGNQKDFWEALMDFRKSITEEGIEITDADFEGVRDNTTGRKVEIG